jgi:hypothetical protein
LKVGERLAIEHPVDFEEQEIKSLCLDGVKVEEVGNGDKTGIALGEHPPKLKIGLRVYRIKEG